MNPIGWLLVVLVTDSTPPTYPLRFDNRVTCETTADAFPLKAGLRRAHAFCLPILPGALRPAT